MPERILVPLIWSSTYYIKHYLFIIHFILFYVM